MQVPVSVPKAALAYTGPFFTMRHHTSAGQHRYRGGHDEADVSHAFGYAGGGQIQLIQLHDDVSSIYHEMFPRGQEGFHHVAILSEDFDRDCADFANEGLSLALEMWTGANVAYFDARPQIGCFVEVIEGNEAARAFAGGWRRAHETWDGTGPLIRDAGSLIE